MQNTYTVPFRHRLFPFALGVGVGGAMCLGLMNFQVVRARDGFHLLEKEHAKLGEMYVDATSFNETDWTDHSAVAAAMTADNKGYLMKERPTSPEQKKVAQGAGSSIPTTR